MMKRLFCLSLAVLSSCTQDPPEPPVLAPVVTRFTASPTTVSAGGVTTLSWDTSNATRVTIAEAGGAAISGVDDQASGTTQVAVGSAGALYVLTAENSLGARAVALASVQVEGASEAFLFVAVPAELPPVGTATLVWSAPRARNVTIQLAGAPLDLLGQLSSGSLVVNPGDDATYTLTADGESKSVRVTRSQAITSLTVTPPDAAPGQTVTIAWTTTGANRVKLTSPGSGTLVEETTVAGVASGNTTWTLPAGDLPHGIALVLTAEGRGAPVERTITLYPSAAPSVLTVTAPAYVRSGSSFSLGWTTQGADFARVTSGGVTLFEGPPNSAVTLPAPANVTTYEVIALRALSNRQSLPSAVTVTPVGVPALVDFSATPPGIATGGTPVTLSWNVTNARNLSIREIGGGVVHTVSGPGAATGSIVIYPNRPTSRYVLDADNLAEDFLQPATVSVTVSTPAKLTFSARRPVGTNTQVTGTTVGAGTVTLFPVARAGAGETFVDIRADGTPLTFASTDTAASLLDVGTFHTQLFDVPISNLRLSVSTNGWMVFNPTSVAGPTTPGTIGTLLQPFALAVFYADLDLGAGRVLWRLDGAAGARRLIVQWTDITDGAAGTSSLTFQAQVYETGKVVYAYETLTGFPASAPAGIVNPAETAVLQTPSSPVSGSVFSFFGDAVLPESIRVTQEPIVASLRLPMGLMRVEGDPRLLPGDLAIAEVNSRPAVDAGEWIELANFSSAPIDLAGYTLSVDGGAQFVVPGPLVLPAGGRTVLAAEALANDGVTADVLYGTSLVSGGALTLSTEGIAISRVDLAALDAGLSVRADPPSTALRFPLAATTQLTCADATNAYGTNGQFGTPGLAHARCFPFVLVRDGGVPFQSIASTGSLVVAGTSGLADETVLEVTPPQPVRVGADTRTSLWVSTNGFIAPASVAPTGVNKTLPSGIAPSGGIIAPYWDELTGRTLPGSGIYWQQFDPNGTPADGDESTVVSWEDWAVDSTTVNSLNFQVRFWANGDVSYHYGAMTAAGTSTIAAGTNATVWLEDSAGRVASAISINQPDGGIASGASFRFVYTP